MSKQNHNMNFLSPNGSTKFCFLFGNEISNSPSPIMHTKWFIFYQLNMIYLPCQIKATQHFKKALESLMKVENFHGANITMPFKNEVSKILNISRSKIVKETSAANTLYKDRSNNWCLENTDIYGIKKTVENLLPCNTNYTLIVWGGGGAAASCIYYGEFLDPNCKKIICVTRDPSKTLKKFPQLKTYKKFQTINSNFKNTIEINELFLDKNSYALVVNTIPANQIQHNSEDNLLIQLIKIFPTKQICYFDMNYKDTFNIEIARNNKVQCLNGIVMLEEQAKQSFFLWTEILP